MGPMNNIPSLVQIMDWRRPGDKPLSEPMMVSLLTHICVTRPQCNTLNFALFQLSQLSSYISHIMGNTLLVHWAFLFTTLVYYAMCKDLWWVKLVTKCQDLGWIVDDYFKHPLHNTQELIFYALHEAVFHYHQTLTMFASNVWEAFHFTDILE